MAELDLAPASLQVFDVHHCAFLDTASTPSSSQLRSRLQLQVENHADLVIIIQLSNSEYIIIGEPLARLTWSDTKAYLH